jgi:hypothetical protein
MTPAGTAVIATSETTDFPLTVCAQNLLSLNQIATVIPAMMQSA